MLQYPLSPSLPYPFNSSLLRYPSISIIASCTHPFIFMPAFPILTQNLILRIVFMVVHFIWGYVWPSVGPSIDPLCWFWSEMSWKSSGTKYFCIETLQINWFSFLFSLHLKNLLIGFEGTNCIYQVKQKSLKSSCNLLLWYYMIVYWNQSFLCDIAEFSLKADPIKRELVVFDLK